ncbi:hypothetical protein FHX37_4205 [Haloactinospora alba]|uniref:Uncharacterized protein n=1 Tax=Haloactinospora alba TaxID=405555 RepID=A0A543N6N5_9ACTN|nr:hypothetical protein [Haloactinospora alba]TQN27485.1 hypothetical protein FHX37_4205 [Haloactinospora alba]
MPLLLRVALVVLNISLPVAIITTIRGVVFDAFPVWYSVVGAIVILIGVAFDIGVYLYYKR